MILVRKWDVSGAGGSCRRRGAAPALGWAGLLASYGLEFAGVGVDGFDGDLVAEAFEGAGVAAGAAADVLASFVVVGAEVGIDGVGIGEQGVADDQLGPSDAALGFFLRHMVAQPPVLGAGEG